MARRAELPKAKPNRCAYRDCTRRQRIDRYCAFHRAGEDWGWNHLIRLATSVVMELNGNREEIHEALVAGLSRLRSPVPIENLRGCIGAAMRWAALSFRMKARRYVTNMEIEA